MKSCPSTRDQASTVKATVTHKRVIVRFKRISATHPNKKRSTIGWAGQGMPESRGNQDSLEFMPEPHEDD